MQNHAPWHLPSPRTGCVPVTRLTPEAVSHRTSLAPCHLTRSADTAWLDVHACTPTLTHFHPLSCTFGGAGWRGRATPVVTLPLALAASCPACRNIYCRHFKSQSENRHLFRFDFKRSQVPFPNYSALEFQRQGGGRVCNNPALFTPCNLWCGFCSRCQGVTFQRELKNSKH